MNNKAVATLNMSFNNGTFKKGKSYSYRRDLNTDIVYVTTEEGNEQDLMFSEFDLLFELV